MAENKNEKVGFFAKVGAFFTRLGKRIAKFWRDYTREMHKVVWMPWKDVKKHTILVVVTCLAFAVAIGVVDLVFSEIIQGLAGLIG